MINLLKPETIKWLVDQCIRSVKDRKLDGVFIDCMAGTAPLPEQSQKP
jgi:hypothetical protein